MMQLSRRAAGEINQHAAGWQERMCIGVYAVLDIIDQAHQARFFALAWRFLNVAAALLFPARARYTFYPGFSIAQVLLTEGFTGFEQDGEFVCQGLACLLIGSLFNASLRLFQQSIEGRAREKMHAHLFRLLLAAQTHAGADTRNGSPGQARKDVLTDQCGQRRAFARASMTDQFAAVPACKIESADCFSHVVAQLEWLRRLGLLELRALA